MRGRLRLPRSQIYGDACLGAANLAMVALAKELGLPAKVSAARLSPRCLPTYPPFSHLPTCLPTYLSAYIPAHQVIYQHFAWSSAPAVTPE
eukprot:6182707-Pleurochrysis_carterae.AAC.2